MKNQRKARKRKQKVEKEKERLGEEKAGSIKCSGLDMGAKQIPYFHTKHAALFPPGYRREPT